MRARPASPHAGPETDLGVDYPARFVVELGGELANGTVACPSHAATTRRVDERFVVELEGRIDRDFIVTIDGLAGGPLTTVAPDGDGWVALASFLLTFSAPAKETSLTRKVLVDCSESMNGDGIEQARHAVARLLNRLMLRSRMKAVVQRLTLLNAALELREAREHRRTPFNRSCRNARTPLRQQEGGTSPHTVTPAVGIKNKSPLLPLRDGPPKQAALHSQLG